MFLNSLDKRNNILVLEYACMPACVLALWTTHTVNIPRSQYITTPQSETGKPLCCSLCDDLMNHVHLTVCGDTHTRFVMLRNISITSSPTWFGLVWTLGAICRMANQKELVPKSPGPFPHKNLFVPGSLGETGAGGLWITSQIGVLTEAQTQPEMTFWFPMLGSDFSSWQPDR